MPNTAGVLCSLLVVNIRGLWLHVNAWVSCDMSGIVNQRCRKGNKKTCDMHHTPSISIHRKANLAHIPIRFFFSGACNVLSRMIFSFVRWSLLIKESHSPSPFGSENLIIGEPCRWRAIFPRWRDLEYLSFGRMRIRIVGRVDILRVDTRLWIDLYVACDSQKCVFKWMYLADVGYLQETGSRKVIFLLIFMRVLFLHGLWSDDNETKVKKLCKITTFINGLSD